MKMKKLVCMLLVFIFTVLVVSVPGAAAEPAEDASVVPVTHYEYPITPDSPDWFNYTVLEKVEMLRIPDGILERMTDEALVTAIAEYPYLVDLGVYGSIDESVPICCEYFSALNELLSRDTAQQAMSTYGLQVVENAAQLASADNDDFENVFLTYKMRELVNYICDDAAIEVSFNEEVGTYTVWKTVYTPKGTAVKCYVTTEGDSKSYHLSEDQRLMSLYNITLVSSVTCLYNCHSYAWYNRSTSNTYRMDDPSAYMTDGSYRQVYSGSAGPLYMGSGIQKGDIVYYGRGSHSAVITASPTASSAAIGNAPCISKWGPAGVFQHPFGEVPASYITTSLTVWRLN